MGSRGFPLTLHSPFPPIYAQFAQSNTTVTARRSMLKGVLPPGGVALVSFASSSSLSFDQAARISNVALRVLQRAVREILPTRILQRYRSRVLSYVTLRWPVFDCLMFINGYLCLLHTPEKIIKWKWTARCVHRMN